MQDGKSGHDESMRTNTRISSPLKIALASLFFAAALWLFIKTLAGNHKIPSPGAISGALSRAPLDRFDLADWLRVLTEKRDTARARAMLEPLKDEKEAYDYLSGITRGVVFLESKCSDGQTRDLATYLLKDPTGGMALNFESLYGGLPPEARKHPKLCGATAAWLRFLYRHAAMKEICSGTFKPYGDSARMYQGWARTVIISTEDAPAAIDDEYMRFYCNYLRLRGYELSAELVNPKEQFRALLAETKELLNEGGAERAGVKSLDSKRSALARSNELKGWLEQFRQELEHAMSKLRVFNPREVPGYEHEIR
ncbi:MAG TPA: hypothetical protein PL033_05880 [Candidatus Brocadiia bacterium]|nr:hypothetical protein [Candidatus Brocadiia bacterium]